MILQTKQAQQDADNATSALQRLLSGDTKNVSQNVITDNEKHINDCISKLHTLKSRLIQQSHLLSHITNAHEDIQNIAPRMNGRLDEIDQHTKQTAQKLNSVLDEKESLMRQLLIARQQLQVSCLLLYIFSF